MKKVLFLLCLFFFFSSPVIANPVLLIHGIDDQRSKMAGLKRYLEARGFECDSFDMVPSDGSVGLEELAKQVAVRVASLEKNNRKVDLVGFSLGGMVARYYLLKAGGAEHVERLVTISSPHHGTYTAFLRQNALSKELRPGSPILEELNKMPFPPGCRLSSIWTPLDLMIFPAWSSRLSGAKEKVIPVLLHPWMVSDGRCFEAVADALSSTSRP